MDVEVAVGVGRGQVAVVDLLAGELQRAVAARGLVRPRRLRATGAGRPSNVTEYDRVAQVHLRLLVREDHAARAADGFVRAGLLGMPVRVDQRVDAVVAGRGLTARSSASALAARPPSIISAPSAPRIATTLQPAPWSSVSAAEIGRRDPRRAVGALRSASPRSAQRAGEHAGTARAPSDCRRPRAMQRRRRSSASCVSRRGQSVSACRSAHELAAHRAARCPATRPAAGPGPATSGFFGISTGRAQLAEQRRLLLEQRRLQRHERHEAARLRVVQRREAVLILRRSCRCRRRRAA